MATTVKERKAQAKRAPEIPATMHAAAIDRFGPPEAIKVHTLPVPTPGPNEVLIALFTAGVGVWDASRRDGTWAEGVRFPYVLGTDGAGVVVAKGSRVRRFEIEDRVLAYDDGGFYAEYVAVAAAHAGHVPHELDLAHAGAGAVTSLTALEGIDQHMQLRADEVVLIFGASGAVGTLAIQFAKRRGAQVIATASGTDAVRQVKQLGADIVIDARNADEIAELHVGVPAGIDAVLALAGGEALERCIDLVRGGGRIVFPEGIEPAPKRRSTLRTIKYNAVGDPRRFTELEEAIHEAHLRVPIAATYPLDRAAQAHARLEQGHVVGRIALRIRRGT
jgi:NADPH2:quinone reductase